MRPALSHALYEMEEFHDRKLTNNKQYFPETWGVWRDGAGWGDLRKDSQPRTGPQTQPDVQQGS